LAVTLFEALHPRTIRFLGAHVDHSFYGLGRQAGIGVYGGRRMLVIVGKLLAGALGDRSSAGPGRDSSMTAPIVLIGILVLLVLVALSSIRIAREYERGSSSGSAA
jgi:hypothetical protein